MCVFCMIFLAITILEDQLQAYSHLDEIGGGIEWYFYLRESPDFNRAFDELCWYSASKELSIIPGVPPKLMVHRGLEIHLTKGFNSAEYQQLLGNSFYLEAVLSLCSTETKQAFESAARDLKIPQLGVLYDSNSYSHDYQLNVDVLIGECEVLLEHYISWWLKEDEPDSDDLNETDMIEPANQVTDIDKARFDLLCRSIYFSILLVDSTTNGMRLLLPIAQRSPRFVSYDADALWLQRIAALKLYKRYGFDLLIDNITSLSATTLYYINTINEFTVDEKRVLLKEASKYPRAATADGNVILIEWLNESL